MDPVSAALPPNLRRFFVATLSQRWGDSCHGDIVRCASFCLYLADNQMNSSVTLYILSTSWQFNIKCTVPVVPPLTATFYNRINNNTCFVMRVIYGKNGPCNCTNVNQKMNFYGHLSTNYMEFYNLKIQLKLWTCGFLFSAKVTLPGIWFLLPMKRGWIYPESTFIVVRIFSNTEIIIWIWSLFYHRNKIRGWFPAD